MQEERNRTEATYLRKNRIYPGETMQGYAYLKVRNGETISATIEINGAQYTFPWIFNENGQRARKGHPRILNPQIE